MVELKLPVNEQERLKELDSYSILDTLSEADYDNLTSIAAEICGTNISLISLIDNKRQWFKSNHGLSVSETPKEYAFCTHAIKDPENVFIIQDARRDVRFYDNPLVTGEPHVIFYAGVPLLSDNGFPLGTLCVIDHKPKLLSRSQIKSLRALAQQVMNILNLRKTKLALEKSLLHLEEKNEELERFAFVAAHDLKSPLIGINGMSKLLADQCATQIDEESKNMLKLITNSSDKLRELIDGLLNYSRCENILKENKSRINLNDLINSIAGLFAYQHNLILTLNTSINEIFTNRTALEQILINLVTNAIKYNDKEKIEIEIGVASNLTHYTFYVLDNGPGIAIENQEKIFKVFEVLNQDDRYGRKGNCIGLAVVKKVVIKSGGTITVRSEPGLGAKFIFSLSL